MSTTYDEQSFKALPTPAPGYIWIAYRTPLRYGSKFEGWRQRKESSQGVPEHGALEQFHAKPLPTIYLMDGDDE